MNAVFKNLKNKMPNKLEQILYGREWSFCKYEYLIWDPHLNSYDGGRDCEGVLGANTVDVLSYDCRVCAFVSQETAVSLS